MFDVFDIRFAKRLVGCYIALTFAHAVIERTQYTNVTYLISIVN